MNRPTIHLRLAESASNGVREALQDRLVFSHQVTQAMLDFQLHTTPTSPPITHIMFVCALKAGVSMSSGLKSCEREFAFDCIAECAVPATKKHSLPRASAAMNCDNEITVSNQSQAFGLVKMNRCYVQVTI